MNKALLLARIRYSGYTVTSFLRALSSQTSSRMLPITFYNKIKGVSDFRRSEIIDIAQVLNLNKRDVLKIFFTELVACGQQKEK